MSPAPYTKPFLSRDEQLDLLEKRGMRFGDRDKAKHLLRNISYYRLSGYWYPLLDDKQQHIFRSDVRFETAFDFYKFDCELRRLVLAELEKIEIAVRSQMVYVMSMTYGHFWMNDAARFADLRDYWQTSVGICKELSRGNEVFTKSFESKYSDPLPPALMTIEIISFGTLSRLYKNLRPGTDKRAIANYFGLNEKVFESWLHGMVYIRNICAHHARLWNRELRIMPILPKNTTNQWLTVLAPNNRLYYQLSIIVYLLNVINPNHSFRRRIKELLKKYPAVNPSEMGFPESWQEEPLWK